MSSSVEDLTPTSKSNGPLSWHKRLWLVMTIYIMAFGYFAWIDLYESQSIEGLYRTHRSPYESSEGLVIDPRPDRLLHQEIQDRLALSGLPSSSHWTELKIALGPRIVDTKLRTPSKGELIMAKDAHNNPILIINHYRDQWVIFRPKVGVVITSASLEPLTDVVVLKDGSLR